MVDDETEIPRHFICPISLQIMKDPVTIPTGITYDRRSIERWLSTRRTSATCPVTNQPLPEAECSDLTVPNHNLRRLIQAWSSSNHAYETIPTPNTSQASVTQLLKTIELLLHDIWVPDLQTDSLKKLAALASDRDPIRRRCMEEAGVQKAMVRFTEACFTRAEEIGAAADAIETALGVLYLLREPPEALHQLIVDSSGKYIFVDAVTWIISREGSSITAAIHGVLILMPVFEAADSCFLARLDIDFFRGVVRILREAAAAAPMKAAKAALRILLQACRRGKNWTKVVEAGAVFELVEHLLSLPAAADRRSKELALRVLEHLCATADGRAQLLGHAAGLAVVSRCVFRVSPAATKQAVGILWLLCRFAGTGAVVEEMARVGVVAKLCMVLQSECGEKVKEKAVASLKLHHVAWRKCACAASIFLVSRHLLGIHEM